MMKYACCIFLGLLFSVYAFSQVREKIDLAGQWQLGLGDSVFNDQVTLPGSLEQNKKGTPVTQPSTQYLNQTYKYTGAAWYSKEIDVPASWKNKRVTLFLERTRVTKLFIDGRLIDSSRLLSAPQVFDCTGALTPGKHRLTIMVNNSPKLVAVGGSHAMSEHTQTNWNGIIGQLFLEATNQIAIDRVRVTPNVKNRSADIQLNIRNYNSYTGRVTLQVNDGKKLTINLKGRDTTIQTSYLVGPNAKLWSEYQPALHPLTIRLRKGRQLLDEFNTRFGLREFKAVGTQFRNNGIVTFLRGKNESCVFPLTGYPAMDTASWRKLFRIAKAWGINHYRFHSYTPPEAAFAAADAEGIYIQAELPLWGNFYIKDTFMTRFQYEEGKAILDAYGNHPSFVLFTLGNELGGEKAVHNKLVRAFRNYDNRRLYAQGTNAFFDNPTPGDTDDFWVTMRTGKESAGREFDVRGSFATTEDTGNGIINSVAPSTTRDHSSAIAKWKLPIVSHEIGQYQVYPDYREMSSYTGVLQPLNFAIFKKRLEDAGMGNQAHDFFKASGELTALLYREEIEMALRTRGLAGFQLLDLQDFPGQGTALVGLLNAFMQNKGIMQPEEFRRFNNDVVIQLLMDKYTWTNQETYTAAIQLVNYSPAAVNASSIQWQIINAATNRVINTGRLPITKAESGAITTAGKISFALNGISQATKLLVKLQLTGSTIEAEYPLWVYPQLTIVTPESLTIATKLDSALLEKLNKGASVLLFPDHETFKDRSVRPQFISEFWNWQVFKAGAEKQKRPVSAGTLGILTNPQHPIFRHFPTGYHSNWQWWSITKNARPLILDKTDTLFRPIVQVIDNIDRNHKLGMIFESRVGKGKLLVCMANLPALTDKPEARQLYYSILQYMVSDEFNPSGADILPLLTN